MPRALYPPDATQAGKTPSADGSDILAVKRAIWRGGRWPGPASGFDNTYSNNFAHGKGGNVVDTGVAGFQRQQGIEDTGWIGETTFNAIRSARIPEGLANAGEPLLDEIAIDLLNDYLGDDEGRVRAALVSFCEQGLGEPDWTYSQSRAVDVTVNPNGPVTSDCSASIIQAYRWAKTQTGISVPDPSKQGYSGYGNSDFYLWNHPTVGSPYLVGDVAHYEGHVEMCMKDGSYESSDWWSFGSEPPKRKKLRSGLLKVVRPPLT